MNLPSTLISLWWPAPSLLVYSAIFKQLASTVYMYVEYTYGRRWRAINVPPPPATLLLLLLLLLLD